jgi:hypothetical protein
MQRERTARRHGEVRFFSGGRQVDEGAFWREVALAAGAGAEYTVKLTPKGIGAALRLAEARRAGEEARG